MALIPVLNLPPAEAGAPDKLGVYAGAGLNGQTPPKTWQPHVDSVRPASVPSPFAREEVTAFLLRNGANHELTKGAEALLYGLVSGDFSLRWVQVAKMGATELREALTVYAGDHPVEPRIGLIGGRQGAGDEVILGFIAGEGVPVLSGHASRTPDAMAAYIRTRRDIEVAYLLDGLRQNLLRQNRWTRTKSWMLLVDRVIASCTSGGAVPIPANAVRLDADVRALGPLQLPMDAGAPWLSTYLLAYAPGFVERLDRALSHTQIDPADASGEHAATLLRYRDVTLARLGHHEGDPKVRLARGEGIVSFLAAEVPDATTNTAAEPAMLRRAEDTRYSLHDHLYGLKATLGCDLQEALTTRPYELSDVARAVGRYRAAAVGEQSPVCFAHVGPKAPKLRDSELAKLEQEGLAVRLRAVGGAAAATAPDMVYLEEAPQAQPPNLEVGDLSRLGLILWQAFSGAERWAVSPTAVTWRDEDVFERPMGFPLVAAAEPVDAWRTDGGALSRHAATVHRFLAAYALPHGQEPASNGARLGHAASRSHVRKWLGVEWLGALDRVAAEPLSAPRAATIPLQADIQGPRGTWACSYGELRVVGDPMR